MQDASAANRASRRMQADKVQHSGHASRSDGALCRGALRCRGVLRSAANVLALILGLGLCGVPNMTHASDASAKATPPVAKSVEETRSTMRNIYATLTTAFRLSLNEVDFGNPAKRQEVTQALKALAENAAFLRDHELQLGEDDDYLRRSLADDARESLIAYERGHYEESRFILYGMTENCISCHSKRPGDTDFDFAKNFSKDLRDAGVLLEDRARIETATRQFDTALKTYEEMFRAKSMTAAQIELNGALLRYLKIALRVKRDPQRAIATLKRFAKRADTPRYLKNQIAVWVTSLDDIHKTPQASVDLLKAAEAMMQKAALQSQFPEDPDSFVYYIEASGLLHRYVQAKPKEKADLAKAFFLLGVAESHIGYSYWLSETDHFLETAIRVDPKGPHAERAYTYLESFTYAGWTGSGGEQLPDDVKAHLAELRGLIDAPPKKKH